MSILEWVPILINLFLQCQFEMGIKVNELTIHLTYLKGLGIRDLGNKRE
jgi:hypothetical protein